MGEPLNTKLDFLSWLVQTGLWALMTDMERAVYIVLWNHADWQTGRCYPIRDTLLQETGYKKSVLYKARKSLHDLGLITWKKWVWKTKGQEKPKFRVTYTLDFNHNCPRLQARARTDVKTTISVQGSREGPDRCIGSTMEQEGEIPPRRKIHLSTSPGEGRTGTGEQAIKEKQAKRKIESSPPLKAGSAPPLSEERARSIIESSRGGFHFPDWMVKEAEEVLKKSHGGENGQKPKSGKGRINRRPY